MIQQRHYFDSDGHPFTNEIQKTPLVYYSNKTIKIGD